MAVIEKFYHFGTTFRINKTPYYKWCINVADPEKTTQFNTVPLEYDIADILPPVHYCDQKKNALGICTDVCVRNIDGCWWVIAKKDVKVHKGKPLHLSITLQLK